MSRKIKIAIPVGDPAGIGPEISLKAALDPAVRAACDPVIVCDPALLERHAKACGLKADVSILPCPQPETATLGFGVTSPVAGRASIAFCAAAVKAAMAHEVDAVVAAPQNETSIAQAGIKFDGHPSFVARQTGSDEDGVYMMLCFGETRIAHCTLHRSVRDSIALDYKRERGAHDPRHQRCAQAHGNRRAEDRGQRPQSACRRRRPVRPRGDRDHQAGDGCGRGRRHCRSAAPTAPTPCSTCRASTPSWSCCTTRATSRPSCSRRTPPPRSPSARRSCSRRSRTAPVTISRAKASPIRRR